MTLASVYRKQDDRININLDWKDTATGTGYLIYYFAQSAEGDDGSGATGDTEYYHLINNSSLSMPGGIKSPESTNHDSWELLSTENVDVYFLNSVTLDGMFIFTGLQAGYPEGGIDGETAQYIRLNISLHEYDGTNETEIVSDVKTKPKFCSDDYNDSWAGANFRITGDIDNYKIKARNYLRLKIKFYALCTDTGGSRNSITAKMYMDPSNASITLANGDFDTNSQIHIPIKQEI